MLPRQGVLQPANYMRKEGISVAPLFATGDCQI
jgi:hypothetical protein